MLSTLQVERQLLKLAGTARDPSRGYPVKIFDLRSLFPDTLISELIDAMKRLSANGSLSLRTWDASLNGDRDYLGEQEDETFFFGTEGFFLKQTPTSVPHQNER